MGVATQIDRRLAFAQCVANTLQLGRSANRRRAIEKQIRDSRKPQIAVKATRISEERFVHALNRML
ncbi:hypothetical protein D3C85_1373810 [compost metagenome]